MKNSEFMQFAINNKALLRVKGGYLAALAASTTPKDDAKVVEKATSGLKDTLKTQV